MQQNSDLFVDTITSLTTVSTQGILLVQIFFWGGAYIIIRFVFGKKNPLLWKLLLINSITCTYYLGINAIFLFSTPTEEALYLAGFDHYSSSMALIALGLAAIFMARQIDYAL